MILDIALGILLALAILFAGAFALVLLAGLVCWAAALLRAISVLLGAVMLITIVGVSLWLPACGIWAALHGNFGGLWLILWPGALGGWLCWLLYGAACEKLAAYRRRAA